MNQKNTLTAVFFSVMFSIVMFNTQNSFASNVISRYSIQTRPNGSQYLQDKSGNVLNSIGTVLSNYSQEKAIPAGYTRLRLHSNKSGKITGIFDVKVEDEIVITQSGREIFHKRKGANVFEIYVPENSVPQVTRYPITVKKETNSNAAAAAAGGGLLAILVFVVCCL